MEAAEHTDSAYSRVNAHSMVSAPWPKDWFSCGATNSISLLCTAYRLTRSPSLYENGKGISYPPVECDYSE